MNVISIGKKISINIFDKMKDKTKGNKIRFNGKNNAIKNRAIHSD
jgi:hypothetical protein